MAPRDRAGRVFRLGWMSGLPKRFEGRVEIAAVRAEAERLEPGEEASAKRRVAGRVLARRDMGKLVFLDLVDASGRIQLLCAAERAGPVDLDLQGFVEVETPVLQPRYGGAFAEPFVTHHNELDRDLYLRIATELYLKRLIVGGLEKVYEIGKDFRNEVVSYKHQPEFTMLEWYEAYADYRDTMSRIEELIERVTREVLGTTVIEFKGHGIDLKAPWSRLRFEEALEEQGLWIRDEEALRAALQERGVDTSADKDW